MPVIFARSSHVDFGPVLGVHASQAQLDGVGTSPATVTVSSNVSGSSFVLMACGAFAHIATPTDNKGNTYSQRGTDQIYASGLWPGFGIRTYAAAPGAGGNGHTIQTVKSLTTEEISIAAFEIGRSSSITATSQGNTAPTGLGVGYASPSITTTGPAIILALWSGDGDQTTTDQSVKVAAPWALVEFSFIAATAYVQFAVAALQVTGAGTYSAFWTPAVNQGAAMSMIAIQ